MGFFQFFKSPPNKIPHVGGTLTGPLTWHHATSGIKLPRVRQIIHFYHNFIFKIKYQTRFRVVSIMWQITSGLDYLHAIGCIHA